MIWWYCCCCCCTHKDVSDAVYIMFSNICTFFCFLFASFQHTLSLSVHAHFSLSFYLCFLFSFSLTSFRLAGQGIAPNVMAPLPKRAALEKANGASAMFNTSMLQYQQALASMQFQQQAAFLPSGMAPKETTTSVLWPRRGCLDQSNLAPAMLGLGKVVDCSTEQFGCGQHFFGHMIEGTSKDNQT